MDCECGCGRRVAKGRFSWACYKAKRRSEANPNAKKVPERGVRHPTPKAMVQEAIEAYNDADPMDSKAQANAWARLRTAWRRYFRRTALNTVQNQPDTPPRG